ncbi:MAG: carboxysome shell carbonic anhydrase [Gammaproteobacteria bacterium]|nr:carboxysome shell carbonic anhydrase [Gammaproteobacteria bacterium]
MQRANANRTRRPDRDAGRAPMRRPGGVGSAPPRAARHAGGVHPLVDSRENERLFRYEDGVKQAFDRITPVLKQISAYQHETDFEQRAQQTARQELGFELPPEILADAWICQLDMKRLFAWCVFETYRRYCDAFFSDDPLVADSAEDFAAFLQGCGFHTLDISPCADGRLAHVIRYVLRLPQDHVRRKSYAGATFDVEDSIQKWVEVEMLRYREGRPNLADAPTRYLKVVVYHFSSVDPEHQGCAAHGSDTRLAASEGLKRLEGFREAIENSFCCGASIDLLLIGMDTDTDSIRVHMPDGQGRIDLDTHIDSLGLFGETANLAPADAQAAIERSVAAAVDDAADGMQRFVARLLHNNLSQIAYVRTFHGSHYADIGHAERFIGAGIGFEEVQLRNLMYFAYLNTVEEATKDMDVGIKIFSGLNAAHGLPIPVVVRFDYHGQVPGARERAVERCRHVAAAVAARYAKVFERGLLHVMQVVRDCTGSGPIEVVDCSVMANEFAGAH